MNGFDHRDPFWLANCHLARDCPAAWAASQQAIDADNALWRELERAFGKRANEEYWSKARDHWPATLRNLETLATEAKAIMRAEWEAA